MKMRSKLLLVTIAAVLGVFSSHGAFAAQSYRVNGASNVTVNEWAECRVVTNQTGAKDTFIPTNTSVEWSEFRIHYPSHISLATCSLSLTVAKAGTGSGTVTSNPAGINCGATCSSSYSSGTSIILSAAASVGSTFAGWSGGGCSGTGTCTVTLNANTTVTATFNVVNYTLTVTKSGMGSGTVSSNPAGINCGATCSATFGGGSSITLTATPNTSSKFAGWSGGGCSGTGTCALTLGASTTVNAKFNPADCKITPPGGKHIFVTSTTYSGPSVRTNAATNTICQNLASGAGLSGTYKAFVYLNGADPKTVLPAGKIFYNGGLTANGCEWFVVANSATELITCKNCSASNMGDPNGTYLQNPITYDQAGTARAYTVWTNTLPNGSGGIDLAMIRDMEPYDPWTAVSCCASVTSCWPCMTYYQMLTASSGQGQSVYFYGSNTSVLKGWMYNRWVKSRLLTATSKCPVTILTFPECDAKLNALYCVEQ